MRDPILWDEHSPRHVMVTVKLDVRGTTTYLGGGNSFQACPVISCVIIVIESVDGRMIAHIIRKHCSYKQMSP